MPGAAGGGARPPPRHGHVADVPGGAVRADRPSALHLAAADPGADSHQEQRVHHRPEARPPIPCACVVEHRDRHAEPLREGADTSSQPNRSGVSGG